MRVSGVELAAWVFGLLFRWSLLMRRGGKGWWLATLQQGEGEAPIRGRLREGREVVDGLSVDAQFML